MAREIMCLKTAVQYSRKLVLRDYVCGTVAIHMGPKLPLQKKINIGGFAKPPLIEGLRTRVA